MIKQKIFSLFIFILLVSSSVSQGYLHGQFFKEDFASEPMVETQINYDQDMILFKIDVDKNYHITDLKNNFFKIELPENEYLKIKKVEFPKGMPYNDELVFKGSFEVPVYVEVLKPITGALSLKFNLSYQVCQENPRELCYPPASKEVDVKFDRAFKKIESGGGYGKQKNESYSQWIERIVKQELEHKSFLLFLLVFVAGFLTSLTPCVYPVIPIVMGYIGTHSGNKKLKGFYLSIFFVLGLAIVYSIFGLIAATTGTMMGLSFQNPLVVIFIAVIFILMGLSLAGLFEIPVPTSLSSMVHSGNKSQVIGSLLVGGVSGIIAVPCVGPVLIALLSWISQTGNILLGFWLTFTFSLGLGVIFLLVGTFSAVLSALPKGGNWMNYVKYFFAFLLLGGGIYFLSTITAEWIDYLLWGVFLIAAAVFMGLFKSLEDDAGLKSKIFKVILVLILLIGAFLFMKALDIKYFPLKYSQAAVENTHVQLPWIGDFEEGKKTALAENKILLVDTYADWCASCKELDKYTFSDPDVSERLKEFVLVRLDFTKKTDANEMLRKSLKVIGMPTVIFFNPEGKEIKRFSGFKDKEKFLSFLNELKD